jgi:hypothetical protein
MGAVTTDARAQDRPFRFSHALDPDLFAPDRLDWLCRNAPTEDLAVQFGDASRVRDGDRPEYTTLRGPVLDDARERVIQVRIFRVDAWGGAAYRDARDAILRDASPYPPDEIHFVTTMVRVFSPACVVALHGDPDPKLVCAIHGHTTWHVRDRTEMSPLQHERLLRGQFFLPWRDCPEQQLEIGPGDGCHVPIRWAHWLTHDGDEPSVSIELGLWTREAVRLRKVYDVNWGLRRLGLGPAAPGGRYDAVKCRAFDAVSLVRGKGQEFRGA